MKHFWSICAALLFASGLSAQDGGQAYSLKQAQDYAMQNSYDIRNAQVDLAIAEKKVKETTAIGLPQISAAGQFQNFIDIPTTVLPANAFNPAAPEGEMIGVQFGTDYNITGSISANQLIFSGSYIVGLQAAKTYKNVSRQMIDKAEIDVKASVTQAYYTVLVADENVAVLKATYDNTQKLYDEAVEIQKQGLMEQQDVDQLKLTVTNLKNNYDMAVRQQELSLQLLKLQMGLDIKTDITLTDKLDAQIETTDMDALLQKDFSATNNIDYQLVKTQESLNDLSVRAEKSEYLPTLAAFFTHQQQALRNEFDVFEDMPWYPSTIWGLSLQVPIFSSGMRASKVSQAKLEVEKTQTTLTQLDQSLQFQAASAKSNYLTAYSVFQNEKDNLALAESIQNTTLAKYKEGMASSMDLTQAQNQYLATQANYIQAAFNLLNAKIELEKLMNP